MKKTATLLILFFNLISLFSSAQDQKSKFDTSMKYEAISEKGNIKGTGYNFIFDLGESRVTNYYSFVLLNKSKIEKAKEIKFLIIDQNKKPYEVIISNDSNNIIKLPNKNIDLVAIPFFIIKQKLNSLIEFNPVFNNEDQVQNKFKSLTKEDITSIKQKLKEYVNK